MSNNNNINVNHIYINSYISFIQNYNYFINNSMNLINNYNNLYNSIHTNIERFLYLSDYQPMLYNLQSPYQQLNTENNINEEYFNNLSNQNMKYLLSYKLKYMKFSDIQNPLNTQCTITLQNFENNSYIGYIEDCNHIFDYTAIKNWLKNNYTCPICRHCIISNSSFMRISNNRNQKYILTENQFGLYLAYLARSHTNLNLNNEN